MHPERTAWPLKDKDRVIRRKPKQVRVVTRGASVTGAPRLALPVLTYVQPPPAASTFISTVPAAKLLDDSDAPSCLSSVVQRCALESDRWKVTARQPGDIYVEKRIADHRHVSLHTPKKGFPSKEARWNDHDGQTRADPILEWGWRFAWPAFHLAFWPIWGTPEPSAPHDAMPDVCLVTTDEVGVDVAIVVLEGHVHVDGVRLIDTDGNDAPWCHCVGEAGRSEP